MGYDAVRESTLARSNSGLRRTYVRYEYSYHGCMSRMPVLPDCD